MRRPQPARSSQPLPAYDGRGLVGVCAATALAVAGCGRALSDEPDPAPFVIAAGSEQQPPVQITFQPATQRAAEVVGTPPPNVVYVRPAGAPREPVVVVPVEPPSDGAAWIPLRPA